MPRQTIPVNPSVLVWARRALGLTVEDASIAVDIPADVLRAFESESDPKAPTIGQLRRLAAAYKRPFAALLLPSAPPIPPLPEDHRTVGGKGAKVGKGTLALIREAQRMQEIASELLGPQELTSIVQRIPRFDALRDGAFAAGRATREILGVTIREQTAWKKHDALNAWRAKVQMQGVMVLMKDLPEGEKIRGFSLYSPGKIPTIVINKMDRAEQARIFTIFHEYGHLALRRGGICAEQNDVRVEKWCNQFAAALLLPEEEVRRHTARWVDSTEDVARLADQYRVSRPAVAIRLIELGLADQTLYDKVEAEADNWKPSDNKREPRIRQTVRRLSEVGIGYGKIVLDALQNESITTATASGYLDLRVANLEEFREKVAGTFDRYGT